MKYLLTILVLVCTIHVSSQQTGFYQSPLFVDPEGKVSDGYLDPDISLPNPVIGSFNVGENFAPGKVYLRNGTILSGKVKFNKIGQKLNFKDYLLMQAPAKTIKAKDCIGFTMLKDSFTVVHNFEVARKSLSGSRSEPDQWIKNDVFVEVLGSVDDYSVLKYVQIKKNSQRIYYLLNKKGQIRDVSEESISWRNDISKIQQFGLTIKEPEDSVIRAYFKELEFHRKMKMNKPQWYSAYLVEQEDSVGSSYKGWLDKKSYKNWSVVYCNLHDDTLMSVSYKSITPYLKQGVGHYFYPDGNVRKRVVYDDEGREVAERRFYENGMLHYSIVQSDKEKKNNVINWIKNLDLSFLNGPSNMASSESGNYHVGRTNWSAFGYEKDEAVVKQISKNVPMPKKAEDIATTYLQVLDEEGNNLLDENGSGEEEVYDELKNRIVYRQFVNHELKSSYYLDGDGNKVYQYCERPLSISGYKSLTNSSEFNNILANFPYQDVPQGYVLIKCIVDSKGNLLENEILSDDKLFKSTSFYWLNKLKYVTFKVARHNGEKVTGEMIVPICYYIKSYAPQPQFNNYWMNNNMWQMQQMQQMQMQSIPKFTPKF